ncbi:DUF11 domain-containing protein [Deinococcus antarcticus]|uniref:DUF11 domain-containing protein n=1 Tax=Deinococcus antarcticus TaxID=1298767 RepID=A0ABV8AAD7_9DEIO
MKRTFQSLIALTAALLGAGTGAQAQEINTSLPLTSIGDRLMWSVVDQNLTLNVPVSGQVRLELYSPRVDPKDYRSDTYFGDETYSSEQVSTKFTLIRQDGSVVMTQIFTPGEQTWETLFDLNLPAGNYRLRAETTGNGKNTFAVRLTGVSADLSAERLAVNVHASDWTPVLNVSVDGAGYALRMYDGDGPQELEARLRDAAGNIYPLVVSGDLAWSDLPLPETAGQYTVELRQPKTAKQFSNTVSFSLTRQGQGTPISISRVDQTGLLRVTAELVLPTGSVPTSVNVMLDGEHLQVNGQTEKTVAAGEHPISVTDLPGATVSVDRPSVTVVKGGLGEAKVQVKPEVALALTSDKQEVCVGDTVTLTARATTAYAGALPLDLNIDIPGLTLSGNTSLQGELSASTPGELRLTGTATQSGPLTATARLAPWNAAQTLNLQVRPDATSLQLTRAPLTDAKIGDEVTVRLSVKNTADQAMPFTLQDQPGAGLEALEGTKFSGTLAAGETRELTYKARVTASSTAQVNLSAQLDSPACPAPQTVGGSLNVAPRPAPEVVRQSTITLPFDAPRQTQTVTIAHAVPAGATFVAGSSKLDGKPVADPKRGPSGTLYWVVPAPTGNGTEEGAALRGTLTYDVNHKDALGTLPKPALSVLLPGNRNEVLEGQFNARDFTVATDLKANQSQLAENEGAIKLPLADTTIRVRDRISITVEAPQGDIPTLTVNGRPVSEDLIGTNTQDGPRGIQRLTFVGVPVDAGKNVISFMGQQIEVFRIGATARIEVTPVNLIADGGTPIRLKIRTLDASGKLTDQPTVTLRSNLEPRTPDANTSESGYQVRLVNGEGIIELQPQSSPTSLRLDILQNEDVQTHTYEVRPDKSRVGVGVVSATVGLNSNFSVQNDLTWQAHAYYEGPIGEGKLYIAADKDKLPTDENTLVRYPVYGDASTESVPLQGIDPVAFTYDHPVFRADYRRTSLPVDVLPVGEQLTALTISSKTDPKVSAFVAMVPRDLRSEVLTPNSTRVLHLDNNNKEISEGSENLELIVLERNTGKQLSSVTLQRNVDYVIDYRSGVITLARALDRVDLDLNEQLIKASYRLDNPLAQRQLAYGVQVKKTAQNYTIGAAAVSLDHVVTFGARATYDNGTTRADGLVAYSSGLQVSADLDSKPTERQTFRAAVRYQQQSYQGLGQFTDGLSVSGQYSTKITDRLTAIVDGEYHRTPTSSEDPVTGITEHNTSQGGSVTARADYKIDPFSVGLGAKYAFGDQYGFGLVGSVGYHHGNTNVDVVHTQPITSTGNLKPTTDITTKFRVAKNLNLGFNDKIEWGVGHSAALTLDTMIGNVNYAAAYELPTASGAGNRARFSVGTTLPLNKNLALGVRGSALYNIATSTAEIGAGADLNYKTERVSATIGSDISYKSDLGFGVVARGGITGSVTDNLTLTADGLMELGQEKDGQRFSLGYAYRARTLASLGYVRYINGTLAGNNPELSTGFSAEYRQPNWAVRGGVDTRTLLKDKDSFTWQASVGGTAYLTDRFGFGAWGRMIGQPASGYQAIGYGVEGSVLALPGAWLTAGYNFKGFEGLPSAGTYTRQGAYLRLDLTLDETLGGKK